MRAGTYLVPMRSRYERPGSIGFLRHPEHVRRELVDDLGRLSARASTSPRATSISSASVSVTASPARGFRQIAIRRDDARRRSIPCRRPRPRSRRRAVIESGGDRAGKAAEVEIRAIDPLHRKAERLASSSACSTSSAFEILEQRRPVVPAHVLRALRDVVAEARGERDRRDRGEAERLRETRGNRATMWWKRSPEKLDQIDLVHRQRDVADAEQRADVAVPARLREHALARIDQDDGGIASSTRRSPCCACTARGPGCRRR